MLDVQCSMFIFSILPGQKQLSAYGAYPHEHTIMVSPFKQVVPVDGFEGFAEDMVVINNVEA